MSAIASAARSPEEAAKVSRTLDFVALAAFFLILLASFHVHAMLLMGDWDFWLDWKDRRMWVTVVPIVSICYPAAMQAFLWERFRLPFGAIIVTLGLGFGQWMSRYWSFHLFAYFPINLVWPTLLIPMALCLDALLVLTKSWTLTAITGGLLYGLLMFPANWPALAVFHLPLEINGLVMSLADFMGHGFTRTAMPEYIRLIERGTLRSFGASVVPVSAFFSGFVCMVVYFIWWKVGIWFSRTTVIDNV